MYVQRIIIIITNLQQRSEPHYESNFYFENEFITKSQDCQLQTMIMIMVLQLLCYSTCGYIRTLLISYKDMHCGILLLLLLYTSHNNNISMQWL